MADWLVDPWLIKGHKSRPQCGSHAPVPQACGWSDVAAQNSACIPLIVCCPSLWGARSGNIETPTRHIGSRPPATRVGPETQPSRPQLVRLGRRTVSCQGATHIAQRGPRGLADEALSSSESFCRSLASFHRFTRSVLPSLDRPSACVSSVVSSVPIGLRPGQTPNYKAAGPRIQVQNPNAHHLELIAQLEHSRLAFRAMERDYGSGESGQVYREQQRQQRVGDGDEDESPYTANVLESEYSGPWSYSGYPHQALAMPTTQAALPAQHLELPDTTQQSVYGQSATYRQPEPSPVVHSDYYGHNGNVIHVPMQIAQEPWLTSNLLRYPKVRTTLWFARPVVVNHNRREPMQNGRETVPATQAPANLTAEAPRIGHHPPSTASQTAVPEYSVACPYGCGTVLTGVHAVGNLTRHLKSQTCEKSGRGNVKYPCPLPDCGKQYSRSDGLKVHLRRRHGAPPAPPKNSLYSNDDDDSNAGVGF
ncbi:hypothetical protein BDV95DRAFT_591591 [Massariosphaeria phaeospora]|uniref:C2H2-type domain-containing protein n=1 Tax=Massariosphaeria phaeospora TaxID=100035 RepID=A0A7C8IE93_9PLEO|nr:hypothetical protein BDV95DRAFT_591591 [Massariosphaeria phaeospora]